MKICGSRGRRVAGFTLIELMITIALVGILTTVAVTTYQSSIRKGNRRAAQAVMMDVNTVQQQFFMANRRYATSLTELGYSLPIEVDANYSFSVTSGQVLNSDCTVLVSATVPGFVVTATAKTGRQVDGDLQLSSENVRCPADKW